eukprot:gene32588-55086_t
MPATSLATAKKVRRKPRTASPARRSRRSGLSFAEGMKPFIGMASVIRYLIDAGPLVGALSVRDQWHTWSARVIATLDEPVFTTEVVFGE